MLNQCDNFHVFLDVISGCLHFVIGGALPRNSDKVADQAVKEVVLGEQFNIFKFQRFEHVHEASADASFEDADRQGLQSGPFALLQKPQHLADDFWVHEDRVPRTSFCVGRRQV